MKKKFLSVVFVLFMLSFMPVIANAASSGNCGADGDNVTWMLDDAGTLTISGTGDMEDYRSSYNIPWYGSRSSITNVIIEEGVTSIGNYVFDRCGSLTSVTIPGSVTSIGSSAFSNCSSLDSVYISDIACYLNIDFGNEYANPMYCANRLYLDGKRIMGTLKIPDGVTKISCC